MKNNQDWCQKFELFLAESPLGSWDKMITRQQVVSKTYPMCDSKYFAINSGVVNEPQTYFAYLTIKDAYLVTQHVIESTNFEQPLLPIDMQKLE